MGPCYAGATSQCRLRALGVGSTSVQHPLIVRSALAGTYVRVARKRNGNFILSATVCQQFWEFVNLTGKMSKTRRSAVMKKGKKLAGRRL